MESNKELKTDLPMELGRDLNSTTDDEIPLNQSASQGTTKIVSGSSNREEGYDLHPHPGDHGEAQKRGSPRESDYNGETSD